MAVDRNVVCDLIAAARQKQLIADENNDADAWLEATEDVNRLLDRLLERQEAVTTGHAPSLG